MSDLSLEGLKALLDYDPSTGVFVYRVDRFRNKAGEVAGYCNAKYWKISINGKGYLAHRLAWFYVYGEWPPEKMDIDHINRDKLDNRIVNLRVVTRVQNSLNRDARGVHFQDGRWKAALGMNYKKVYVGGFKTEQEARDAYLRAKEQYETEASTARR